MGHDVKAIDIDEAKIAGLSAGHSPIFEPHLSELLWKNQDAGRLQFISDYDVDGADFVFIAVSTPSTPEGAADLRHVRDAVHTVASRSSGQRPTIVNKSTSPVGTGDSLDQLLSRSITDGASDFPLVSNPEFLREGTAVYDFFHPDRVVLGSRDQEAARRVAELYEPLGAPILFTDIKTAEMIKYASNAFLATKISFINEIASICESVGADIADVARAMGLDDRIGAKYLAPGLGFGGSCLPKDVRALSYLATVYGAHPQMLNAVLQINAAQRRRVIRLLRQALSSLEGKRIALLGLAFKPDTDDIREAPSVDIARLIINDGGSVHVYDPAATSRFVELMPEAVAFDTPQAACVGADAAVVITEWPEFATLDLQELRSVLRVPLLGDCRNVFGAEAARVAGLAYFGVGVGLMFAENMQTPNRPADVPVEVST
jgi:UDPglucose 6-dehydrogenase